MLKFNQRGRRLRPGGPLHYATRCGRYEVVQCDQVGGVRWRDYRYPDRPARPEQRDVIDGRVVITPARPFRRGRPLPVWWLATDLARNVVISRHRTRAAAEAACQKHAAS